MGWQAAVVGALGASQYKAQGAAGKYNQAVANRNALVAEQEAEQIEKQTEFDIAQFDKQFTKLEGETSVALAKSGVVQGTGTAYRISMQNAVEAELQKNIMEYNAKVGAARKMEDANFAKIQGTIAKQQSKMAQIGTLASTGTSLLRMKGIF
jgi:hypothetical protein|tara:strand:- start:4283 stop:4738 length:456 start_codon:yes stop_codon:yes gene_type:complete